MHNTAMLAYLLLVHFLLFRTMRGGCSFEHVDIFALGPDHENLGLLRSQGLSAHTWRAPGSLSHIRMTS